MPKIITSFVDAVCDALFPPVCLNCKTSIPRQKQWLCENCFAHIRLAEAIFCSTCNAPCPKGAPTCHPQTPYLLAPATIYEEPVPSLIHAFKYKKLFPLEMFLSAVLVVYMKQTHVPIRNSLIVPIPLHLFKERQRGFNQSEALAKRIARYFNLPYTKALSRVGYTKPQAELTDEKRKQNMRGCFACTRPDEIKNKNILLVDDVSTTGATLYEASSVLRENGAKQIIALVIARA